MIDPNSATWEAPPPPSEADEQTPEPSPNNPPWNSLVAFLFWIVSVLLIGIVPVLFLIPYVGTLAPGGDNLEQRILGDPVAVLVALAGTFGAHIITLAIAWVIVTRMNTYSFTGMLGWDWGGFKLWHGLLIFLTVYAAAIGFSTLLGNHDNEMLRILKSSRGAVFAVVFIATFSAPIVEEVVYRGILYSAFQRSFSVPVAVIAVTVIFALVHVSQYYPDGATIMSILLLSLILTVIRAKTDNLLPCVFFHFVFNGFQSMLLVLQPYLPAEIDPTNIQSIIIP